jgi:hypothetical protein
VCAESQSEAAFEWNYWRGDIPDATGEVIQVEFKLLYHGQLRASTTSDTRVNEKHAIRKQLHKQLKELWQVQPILSSLANSNVSEPGAPRGKYVKLTEATANKYARCGYRFIPLISQELSLTASLDILFLRRDHPGNLITSGGDIDNRIKTLFDALRMPHNNNEIPKKLPVELDENPFYVLLEDDSQITKVSVSTDRLLTPAVDGEHVHDVHLVIGVTVNVIRVRALGGNLGFLSS